MKKMLLIIALAVVASFAWGQTTRQPLMKTQDVLRGTSGPVRYRFGKTVTYVTRSGRVLDENTVRTRIKVGVPVRVHYVGTGEKRMVDRVILEED